MNVDHSSLNSQTQKSNSTQNSPSTNSSTILPIKLAGEIPEATYLHTRNRGTLFASNAGCTGFNLRLAFGGHWRYTPPNSASSLSLGFRSLWARPRRRHWGVTQEAPGHAGTFGTGISQPYLSGWSKSGCPCTSTRHRGRCSGRKRMARGGDRMVWRDLLLRMLEASPLPLQQQQ